jgi:histidine triad (HIT) family protein
MVSSCVFCKIVAGEINAFKVYEDEIAIVFLDNGPLFPGHCLVCPKEHYDTMLDLPPDILKPLFTTTQLIARAIEEGLEAEGTFVAINNRISQSVPHLHIHVIPRRRKDGMKGFFWPRRPYKDEQHSSETAQALRDAIERINTRTA